MRFWKRAKFKDLNQEWYKKLKESGFDDHENEHEELVNNNPHRSLEATHVVRECRLEYYLRLSQGVNDEQNFDNGIDYFIMAHFAEGMSNKEIVKELALLGHPRHRKTVMYIRRKYENRWGIRKWRPDQLKSQTFPYKKQA